MAIPYSVILASAACALGSPCLELGLSYANIAKDRTEVEAYITDIDATDNDAFEVSAAAGNRVIKKNDQYLIQYNGKYTRGDIVRYHDRSPPKRIGSLLSIQRGSKGMCNIPISSPEYILITKCGVSVLDRPSIGKTVLLYRGNGTEEKILSMKVTVAAAEIVPQLHSDRLILNIIAIINGKIAIGSIPI